MRPGWQGPLNSHLFQAFHGQYPRFRSHDYGRHALPVTTGRKASLLVRSWHRSPRPSLHATAAVTSQGLHERGLLLRKNAFFSAASSFQLPAFGNQHRSSLAVQLRPAKLATSHGVFERCPYRCPRLGIPGKKPCHVQVSPNSCTQITLSPRNASSSRFPAGVFSLVGGTNTGKDAPVARWKRVVETVDHQAQVL